MPSKLLTPKQVAVLLAISRSKAYEIIRVHMQHIRIDGSVRVSETELERYIRARTVAPATVQVLQPRRVQPKLPGTGRRTDDRVRLVRPVSPRTKPRTD